jgi:hypothetical protein
MLIDSEVELGRPTTPSCHVLVTIISGERVLEYKLDSFPLSEEKAITLKHDIQDLVTNYRGLL